MSDAKPKDPVRRLPRIGTLSVLAGLMIGSAGLRVLSGADAFMARAAGEPAASATTDPTGSTEQQEFSDAAPDTLLAALREQKARLEKRERAVQLREKALKVADLEITEKMDALVDAEARLRQTISLARGAAEADVAGLTEVYSRMKPKNAATLFQEMAPEFAAGFMGRMKPEVAAAIMAGLTPERAYAISAILAARHADVPKEGTTPESR
ncbi:MotE family protein [Roseivivax sp. CAU 1753]